MVFKGQDLLRTMLKIKEWNYSDLKLSNFLENYYSLQAAKTLIKKDKEAYSLS